MANSGWKIYNLVVLYVQFLEVHQPAKLHGDVTELVVPQEEVLELRQE
jgi:hypothetical protein